MGGFNKIIISIAILATLLIGSDLYFIITEFNQCTVLSSLLIFLTLYKISIIRFSLLTFYKIQNKAHRLWMSLLCCSLFTIPIMLCFDTQCHDSLIFIDIIVNTFLFALLLIPVLMICIWCDMNNDHAEVSSVRIGDPWMNMNFIKVKIIPDEACSICQKEFKYTDNDSGLLRCGHRFHETCISDWITINDTCPICRKKVDRQNSNSLPIPEPVMPDHLEPHLVG
jgi:hypothetical protein